MDINHPLYITLKEYYTSVSTKINSEKNDGSLLIQYIEDTYDTYDTCKKLELELGLELTQLKKIKYDECYYCKYDIDKTTYSIKFYCYFSNKLIYKNASSRVILNECVFDLGKYKYFEVNDYGENSLNYLINNFKNTLIIFSDYDL